MVTALEYLACLAGILSGLYFNLWEFKVLYEREAPPSFFNLLALSLI